MNAIAAGLRVVTGATRARVLAAPRRAVATAGMLMVPVALLADGMID